METIQRIDQVLANSSHILAKQSKYDSEPKVCSCGKIIEPMVAGRSQLSFIPNYCHDCSKKEHELNCLIENRKQKQANIKYLKTKIAQAIPPLYRESRLGYLSSALQNKILSLSKNRGLYLWGVAGVGKSYTMAAIMRRHILRGYSVKRTVWDRLNLELRATYNTHKSELSLIKPLLECDALFIEDIGTSVSMGNIESDFCLRTLLVLIDDRIENRKQIFVTSNKSLKEIRNSFDERISSRIQSACEVIRITGNDRRKSQACCNPM